MTLTALHLTDGAFDIDRYGRIRYVDHLDEVRGLLTARHQDVGTATLVSIHGTLDRSTSVAFAEVLTWMAATDHSNIHFDLTDLRIVDVFGMEAIDGLLEANEHMDILLPSEALERLRELVTSVGGSWRQAA